VDQRPDYVVIAEVRIRDGLRGAGLGAFLATGAFILAPSVWPVAWLLVLLIARGLDIQLHRPTLARPEVAPSMFRRKLFIVSSASIACIYSAIIFYFWFRGGQPGQVVAIVQAACALLHIALHAKHVRPALLWACLPHAACLFGLPLLDAAMTGFQRPLVTLVVTLSSLIYAALLMSAVRLSAARIEVITAAVDRAEQASAAKSDFLTTISHEIRTPMNAVISAGHLLKRTELTPEQAEHVDILEQAGEVLIGLLNDVLDISKIEANKMTLEIVDVSLRARLEGLVVLWSPKAKEKALVLRLHLDPKLPERIRTDPLRLQQILFNLLSNALKFTEAGSVDISAVVIDGSDGPRLSIVVRDTGCGISAEAQGRIFASFEQAEAGTTRQYGGTGLGLAISRRLAELMGGSLTLHSRLGAGSSFTFDIPLVEASAMAEPEVIVEDESEPDPCSLAVLVAEDHAVNRRIVALLLEPMGFELTFAVNGREAVDMAGLRTFDVILMDMQMPLMNGLEATRTLRSEAGPNALTPVLALTANAMDHHRDEWAKVGVDVLIAKPIDPASLVRAMLTAKPFQPVDDVVQQARASA
jgi:signal transduction histidine kinase/ActR/RegA family two-component response regulator